MQSEQLNELAAALSKAQGTMKNAIMNRTNPHFKSKYADLASVLDATRAALSANGIAVSQIIDDGRLETMLIHTSGQWLCGVMQLPVTARPQELGSCLTYYRRYALSSITGVSADDDDDANAAEAAKQRAPAKPAPNVMSELPPHDPETGEMVSPPTDIHFTPVSAICGAAREDRAGRRDAAPAAPAQQEPAGAAGISIEAMAREAAMRGHEHLAKFYKAQLPEGKRKITLMKADLESLYPRPSSD